MRILKSTEIKNALIKYSIVLTIFILFSEATKAQVITKDELISIERARVLKIADRFMSEEPVTITAYRADRSKGGIHDYYSEGTYWWPNPNDPNGPYIRKDGILNPDNFELHAKAVRKFSIASSALTAAYIVTGKLNYAQKAIKHFEAWFINPDTRMNPSLLYAQAIKGVVTGRGIGIIDMIHLIEVARSVMILEKAKIINQAKLKLIKAWFKDFLVWMTTHQYGVDEKNNGNNHSTWWAAQVAMYSLLVGDKQNFEMCKEFLIDHVLTKQMAENGSFPEELKRTKPYSYSLFNLEGTILIAKILSLGEIDVWDMKVENDKSLKNAVEFMYPFIVNKSEWTYPRDVENYDILPVRMEFLLFSAIAFNDSRFISAWKILSTDYKEEELIRTFPVRQPVLWIN